MKDLLEILSLRRPYGGKNERFVAEEILYPQLPTMEVFDCDKGNPMAYVCEIGECATTLFVAHLDTVHSDEKTPNKVSRSGELMFKLDGTPLGADDGAGVWLLLQMAKAGVPGTYLWTVGEEVGGVGARYMATNKPDFLRKFKRAIAFDRKGTRSVITHQGFVARCCSDEFAEALCAALPTTVPLESDSGGVYTDTAEFTEIIPECTNLSVGYYGAHTGSETLDLAYLHDLVAACIVCDWESLPTVRDPALIEPLSDYWGGEIGGLGFADQVTYEDILKLSDDAIVDLVHANPDGVVEFLLELKKGVL